MRLSLRLEPRQEQRQVFHLRMIQSMELLQMPLATLEERIETELEQNPLLEINDEFSDTSDPDTTSDLKSDTEVLWEHEPEIHASDEVAGHEDFSTADEFAESYPDTIDELPARSQDWIEKASDYAADQMANIPAHAETLQDHLLEQLAWFDLTPPLHAMVERVISHLDAHGFFSMPMNEFLPLNATDDERTLAEEAVRVVQQLEPTGVGTRDVSECLLLQLRDDHPNAHILRPLIAHHLSDVAHNRLPKITQSLGFSLEDIQSAITSLRQFSPFPAAAFGRDVSRVIRPEIFVERTASGAWQVRLDDGRSTSLRIAPHYQQLIDDKTLDKEASQYIREKNTSARWLIGAIAKRRRTLLRVSQAIVDHQQDFFERGAEAIKPLKMQQIADVVELHVTTISRACDDKWMMTPHGVVPLKRFFSSSVAAKKGDDISQDVAFLKLREIIDGEDKKRPYSDEKLVQLLDDSGVKLARRTVVKYRQAMGIPSSRERKEW